MLPQEKVQNLIDRHRKLESDLSSGEIDKIVTLVEEKASNL